MKELIKGKKLSKQYYADTRRDAYDVMNSQIVYSEKEVDCVFLYLSKDNGEHWSLPITHEIPLSASKTYSGTLSNGRNYLP